MAYTRVLGGFRFRVLEKVLQRVVKGCYEVSVGVRGFGGWGFGFPFKPRLRVLYGGWISGSLKGSVKG